MPSRCVVGGCSNKPDAKKGIRLHIIPYFSDDRTIGKARRRRWVDFVSRRRKYWTPSGTSSVCSSHFKADDYSQKYSFGEERHLAHLMRDDIGIVAFPSVYLDTNEQQQQTPRSRRMVSIKAFELSTMLDFLIEIFVVIYSTVKILYLSFDLLFI